MPDASYHLFSMIKSNSLALQNYRYSAIFTQIPILFGLKMNISLESLTKLYSLSLILPWILTHAIIVFIYKNYRLSLLYIFCYFIMMSHGFFFAHGEIFQGFAFFLLWLAHLLKYKKDLNLGRPIHVFIMVGLSFFLIFSHPLLVIAITFALAFLWLDKQLENGELIKIAILLCLIILLNKLFFSNRYDYGAMSNLKNIFSLFPDYFTLQSFKNLPFYFYNDYYLVIIAGFIILFYYLRNREFAKLMVFLTFFIGVVFIVSVSYPNGAEQFYLEGQYSVLALVVGLPLSFDVYNFLKTRGSIIVILVIFFSFIYRLENNCKFYKNRIAIYEDIILVHKNTKLLFLSNSLLLKQLGMTWGSSFETWLLSTIKTGKSSSIIITSHPDKFKESVDKKNVWMTEWETIDYENLNPKYFVFRDTGTYEIK